MSNKNILKVDYFNVNDKKNSILENAPYQNNDITMGLDAMEGLTNKIRDDILRKDKSNNVDCSIDFKKNKK